MARRRGLFQWGPPGFCPEKAMRAAGWGEEFPPPRSLATREQLSFPDSPAAPAPGDRPLRAQPQDPL